MRGRLAPSGPSSASAISSPPWCVPRAPPAGLVHAAGDPRGRRRPPSRSRPDAALDPEQPLRELLALRIPVEEAGAEALKAFVGPRDERPPLGEDRRQPRDDPRLPAILVLHPAGVKRGRDVPPVQRGIGVDPLPEDDANRQIARGFSLHAPVKERNIHILPVAGGWTSVRESFEREYNDILSKRASTLMVLLVDFDERGERRAENVRSGVDASLKDRVFVLGARGEPEQLRTTLKLSFEKLGRALAKECHEGTREVWRHDLLAHNAGELDRMLPKVRPILFG